MQEEHVLERWRASSSPMKGVCSVREKRKFLTRGKGVREWRGFLSYRGVQMNRTHRISSLSQIYADYQSTQVSSLSQIYTEEQNIQHFTETLSQPISQNLTAIFSSNALCYLYAGGLLWARNVCQKGSVRSVSSVRENTSQRLSSGFFLTVDTFYFSQIYTDEQNA